MFTLDIKKANQKLEIKNESDLKELTQLLSTAPNASSTQEHASYYESCKIAFRTANAKDQSTGGTDQLLLQKAWDEVCKWAGKTEPLPSFNMKTKTGTKSAPSTSTTVSTVTYDPQVEQDATYWVTCMKQLCLQSATSSVNLNWTLVRENVLHLSSHRNDDGFITSSLQKAATIASSQVTEAAKRLKKSDGLMNVLGKLSKAVEQSKLKNEVANFYGAFNEAMDLFMSLVSFEGSSRFSVPKSYKKFNLSDVPLGARSDTGALLQQDIDRIEVHNGVKYYIEVKSDVGTAVHKHSPGVEQKSPNFTYKRAGSDASDDEKFGTSQQLLRMLAVIQHRAWKNQSTMTKNPVMAQVPAVSILNPKGWLELFTSGTARVYARLGFHLFIAGTRFTPQELLPICDEMDDAVIQWAKKEKGLEWASLQYKEKKPLRHDFFKEFSDTFGPPEKWKK